MDKNKKKNTFGLDPNRDDDFGYFLAMRDKKRKPSIAEQAKKKDTQKKQK